jgi:trans-aconitate 2-methyltransferase
MVGMATWDPARYEQFSAERARPFHELIARIPTGEEAVAVVDLGCGPGTMTATLARRWPQAAILGIDSSPDMIEAAKQHISDQVGFRVGDLAQWQPVPGSMDVIVANASLQWVPGHAELLTGWAKALDDRGSLAFQVPHGKIEATEVMREVAKDGRWADRLAGVAEGTGPRATSPVLAPAEYVGLLSKAGLEVDCWETTYYHVLPGEDAVLEWFSGTGLRPYLDALADDQEALEAFRGAVADRLREVYPRHGYGTVLPFPRLFVVAHRSPEGASMRATLKSG